MADSQVEAEVVGALKAGKPMDWQLRDLWEENGDKRGVPEGVRDLLNAAFTRVSVSSFPDLPSGKGTYQQLRALGTPAIEQKAEIDCNPFFNVFSMTAETY